MQKIYPVKNEHIFEKSSSSWWNDFIAILLFIRKGSFFYEVHSLLLEPERSTSAGPEGRLRVTTLQARGLALLLKRLKQAKHELLEFRL